MIALITCLKNDCVYEYTVIWILPLRLEKRGVLRDSLSNEEGFMDLIGDERLGLHDFIHEEQMDGDFLMFEVA